MLGEINPPVTIKLLYFFTPSLHTLSSITDHIKPNIMERIKEKGVCKFITSLFTCIQWFVRWLVIFLRLFTSYGSDDVLSTPSEKIWMVYLWSNNTQHLTYNKQKQRTGYDPCRAQLFP